MSTTTPMRGAIPSPRAALAAASPFVSAAAPPAQYLQVPSRISMWGNDVHGDCVTAEEAFAKACHTPEIFISDSDAIAWATRKGVLEGAVISDVLSWMETDGFVEAGAQDDDGSHAAVDWTNPSTLQNAIVQGPVKLGVAADQIQWAYTGVTGWFGTGFQPDPNEDHSVSLCGYGSMSWLATQLGVQVPAGVNGDQLGYAMFTWDTIGILDAASVAAITHEAWLRNPTTVIVPLPSPGAFSSVGCAGVGMQLQLAGLASGQLWHTLRNADGSWQSMFGLIESLERNNPGAFTSVGSAGVGNQLQVVGVVNGQLWHTIRNADGSWAPQFGLIEAMEHNNPGAFTSVSCAGVGNQLQVVGVVNGQLWHIIRNADGSWAPQFGLIEAMEHNNPGAFTSVSCAGVGNQLHVVGIVNGQLWHTIRNADGTWQANFGLIEAFERNNPGPFTSVSCAGVGNQLQVVGVVNGQLWHTIRNADGSWAPQFGLIEAMEHNNPGAFTLVSCAGVGTQLQVVGVVNGQLWHTIRNADGSWQSTFGLIEAFELNGSSTPALADAVGVVN